MSNSRVMKKLLENMAGVKVGQTVVVPPGWTVNGFDESYPTNRPSFCAIAGQTVKVLEIDLVGGTLLVEGPGGQRGLVRPGEFPGAKEF